MRCKSGATRPYLLMGEPVDVQTQIQVNFQLR
jgi:hypothetical protein